MNLFMPSCLPHPLFLSLGRMHSHDQVMFGKLEMPRVYDTTSQVFQSTCRVIGWCATECLSTRLCTVLQWRMCWVVVLAGWNPSCLILGSFKVPPACL